MSGIKEGIRNSDSLLQTRREREKVKVLLHGTGKGERERVN